VNSNPAEQFTESGISHTLIHGQRILVKSASGRDRARLRHEAEVLGLLQLPALVELVELKEEDDQTRLLLVDNGPLTLLRPLNMTGEDILRTMQRCCTAVEQLHHAGWSHGALRPEHVLLGIRGRAKLCSLGEAQPLNHLSAPAAAAAVRADVSQLAHICGHLADVHITWTSRRDRRRWRHQSAGLRQLSHATTSTTQDLTTSGLKSALEDLKSGRRKKLRTERFGTSRTTTRAPARGLLTLGLAAGSVALLFCTGFALTASNSTPNPAAKMTSSTSPPQNAADIGALAEVDTCELWPRPAFEIGAGSCPENVTVNGQFITVGEVTYQLGNPEDRTAVGDWDCDGRPTALLLRPSTGELFEFTSWATPDVPVQSHLVTIIPNARDLSSEQRSAPQVPKSESCDRPVVALTNGSQIDPLPTPARAKP